MRAVLLQTAQRRANVLYEGQIAPTGVRLEVGGLNPAVVALDLLPYPDDSKIKVNVRPSESEDFPLAQAVGR